VQTDRQSSRTRCMCPRCIGASDLVEDGLHVRLSILVELSTTLMHLYRDRSNCNTQIGESPYVASMPFVLGSIIFYYFYTYGHSGNNFFILYLRPLALYSMLGLRFPDYIAAWSFMLVTILHPRYRHPTCACHCLMLAALLQPGYRSSGQHHPPPHFFFVTTKPSCC